MIGNRLGPYEVVAKLGEGGMGEVFRARDAVLGRDVALKVLPPLLAADADRRARLNREARVLASLNHPHIAHVYGLEQAADGPVLVMELVEGRTLQTMIARGAPVPDAMAIARQIADALDAAHARDIVHRDLKPANVKVTADGTVKVLDFGLARTIDGALTPDSAHGSARDSASSAEDADAGERPTVTSADLTTVGRILGTVTYMSPEQARGLALDRRTDIWSFGCLLFELYAGRPPFRGATSSDLVAAILGSEPDWQALPAETPPAVRRLLRWCLEKDRRRRLRDIGDAAPLLSADADAFVSSVERPAPARGRAALLWTLAALAVIFASATVGLLVSGRGASQAAVPPVTFSISPPPGTWFGGPLSRIETTTVALSPDGSTLAFLATHQGPGGTARIWLRPLSRSEAEPLPGTEGASSVFWSPDSRSLAFFADGKLKRIDATGGTAVPIGDVPVVVGLSGTWNRDGDILFASVQGDGIFRVPAAGGVPEVLIAPQTDQQRVLWPRFLPDGRHFLYSTLDTDYEGQVLLAALDGSPRPLLSAASLAQWVDPDWVIFVRESALLAQRVDLGTARLLGDPVPVAGPIAYSTATGWSNVTATSGGLLAYESAVDVRHIAWFDRTGRETARVGAPGGYLALRLSPDPDASTLLFSRLRPELGTYDLWTTSLARGTETRVTAAPGMETGETWLPDGRTILFAAARGAAPNIFRVALGGGDPEQLLMSPRFQFPNDVSPDGRLAVYQQRTELGNWDLMLLPLDDPTGVTSFASTPFSEYGARFSPLGDAIAFGSDESGRPRVYVGGFPDGPRTPVSADSAGAPRWRRDGRELYFLSGGQLMAVPIDASGTPGTARALFAATGWTDFDAAPDGQRFIALVADSLARDQPITVIQNWPGLVAR